MPSTLPPTALIADDEPLLREALTRLLAQVWPELEIVAQARNGREAVEHYEALQPEICFLDVHMPGLNGVEAAQRIGRRAQIVFITAYDQYAVKAFEQGALDYLVKPVEVERLADTIGRIKERLKSGSGPADAEQLIAQLAERLGSPRPAGQPLRWIRASVGQTLRLIPVDEIDYLKSDEKYTLVAWKEGEALIRTPLKELIAQLDAEQFAQVHRSVVVNLRAISHVTRGLNETADVHLKGRDEVLPVSRSYLHLFRQM